MGYATLNFGKLKRPFARALRFLIVYSRVMETRIETFGKL
jgi:hypothetical protein